jgi:hypothetical protein
LVDRNAITETAPTSTTTTTSSSSTTNNTVRTAATTTASSYAQKEEHSFCKLTEKVMVLKSSWKWVCRFVLIFQHTIW